MSIEQDRFDDDQRVQEIIAKCSKVSSEVDVNNLDKDYYIPLEEFEGDKQECLETNQYQAVLHEVFYNLKVNDLFKVINSNGYDGDASRLDEMICEHVGITPWRDEE